MKFTSIMKNQAKGDRGTASHEEPGDMYAPPMPGHLILHCFNNYPAACPLSSLLAPS